MEWPHDDVSPDSDRNVSPFTNNPDDSNVNLGNQLPQPPSSTATFSSSPSGRGKHRNYRGIRRRSGKWVSEICEPGKATRIWLGTYPTAEVAAAAYDVALLILKGPGANFNFPDSVSSYPVPASASASTADIRDAAAMAAEARREMTEQHTNAATAHTQQQSWNYYNADEETGAGSSSAAAQITGEGGDQFIDEEALFDMPNLLANMAEGMLVSQPRVNYPPKQDDSPSELSGGDNLWNYP